MPIEADQTEGLQPASAELEPEMVQEISVDEEITSKFVDIVVGP